MTSQARRRTGEDRRMGVAGMVIERRHFFDPTYTGPERRSGRDRRVGDRRTRR